MLCSVGNRAWFIFFIVVPVGSTYRLFPVLLLKKVRFTALMYSSFLFCFTACYVFVYPDGVWVWVGKYPSENKA